MTIDTSDTNGPVAMTSVVTWAGITGLHLYHSSVITFVQSVTRVEVTLAHFSSHRRWSPTTATEVSSPA